MSIVIENIAKLGVIQLTMKMMKDNPETEDVLNDETTTSHSNFERKLSEAQYLLKLKSQHNLTQISISEIIDATKGLIADRLQIVKKNNILNFKKTFYF